MIYAIGIALFILLVLLFVSRIVRWWNLPAVAEARASRAIERQKQRTERIRIRREARERRRSNDDEIKKTRLTVSVRDQFKAIQLAHEDAAEVMTRYPKDKK